MRQWRGWRSFLSVLRGELRHLFTVHASDRHWLMPVAAAAASGLPLLIGAWFDHLDHGLAASLGGMVFLYLPNTPLHHRMAWLMACAFGMSASYTLGTLSHLYLPLMVPVLTFIATLVTMVCRFYAVGPPGSLFFIMAAAIGGYSPAQGEQVALQVGLVTMGGVLACLIAFFYSLALRREGRPHPEGAMARPSFDFVVTDSVVIGAFVGISLALAQALQLSRPYWVPVSCLAVIQGATLRAVWNKQVQRIAGTVVGLALFWALLALPLDRWSVALMVIVLTFVVESLVTRHYGLAVVFITPLTILLADAALVGGGTSRAILQSRLADTVLGCVVGLAGGVCLHSPRLRDALGRRMRRLVPSRLMR